MSQPGIPGQCQEFGDPYEQIDQREILFDRTRQLRRDPVIVLSLVAILSVRGPYLKPR